MSKRCTRCFQWKEDGEFYKDKSKLDGLKSHCKPCHEAYKRGYRATPAARLLEERLDYLKRFTVYDQAVPDHVANFRAWRARSLARRKARLRAEMRKWHARHRNESRIWQRENHETIRANRQGIRAASRQTPINTLSSAEWQWLLEVYGFRCAYCGQHGQGLTPDHIIPLARGGDNSLGNIAPACGPCNLRKGARTPDEAGMEFTVRVNVMGGLEQLALM